jgi:hypothetical protein
LRHFFKNQKFIPEDRLDYYHDFTKTLSKLNSVKYRPDAAEAEKLKSQIHSTEKVFMKRWLLEKAEGLASK